MDYRDMWHALALTLLSVMITSAEAQSPLSPEWTNNPTAQSSAQTPVEPPAKWLWYVGTEKSKIDDSINVYMTVPSKEDIPGRYGRRGRAEIAIRCSEGVTMIYFTFAGHFLSSIQQYGRLVTRIDKRPARTVSMRESTDHSALGLWSGRSSIPFIKSLFAGETLFVRVTPYSESSVDAEFNISGIEQAIAPLRKACRW